MIYALSIQPNMRWIITEIQDVQWAIMYDLEDIHNEARYSGDLVNGSLALIFVMHQIWLSEIVTVRLTSRVLLVN